MKPQPSPIALTTDRFFLGEGPVWDATNQRIIWVDIGTGRVLAVPVGEEQQQASVLITLNETVGCVALSDRGDLLVAGARDVHEVHEDGGSRRSFHLIDDSVGSRLNDGTCDPRGRFLVGSLALDGREGQERLFSIDDAGNVRTIVEGLTASNGIAFSPDGNTLYLVDSGAPHILCFEYDLDSGIPSAPRALPTTGAGIPDGLTVDDRGNLWVAYFDAGQVRQLTPGGVVMRIIEIPAPNPTCPAFVGPALDKLVVTTAQEHMRAGEIARYPLAGAVLVFDVGTTGMPPHPWTSRPNFTAMREKSQ